MLICFIYIVPLMHHDVSSLHVQEGNKEAGNISYTCIEIVGYSFERHMWYTGSFAIQIIAYATINVYN